MTESLGVCACVIVCVIVCVCVCVCAYTPTNVCVYKQMEDEGRRLEEQNRLAGFQFQKLGEESSRLLSACEVERDLRSKLEAALHIKERQVRPRLRHGLLTLCPAAY